jgi:hypothetical protein
MSWFSVAFFLTASVLVGLNSCSKINICGQESKLYGNWIVAEYIEGDSQIIPSLIPILPFPDTLSPYPIYDFEESGLLRLILLGDTTIGSYRMERYETKCLIYSDLLPFRWVIKSLGSDKIDLESWALIGPEADSLVTTTLTLEKR